jgi:diguanylate cyclase (GGDEF)-like protein
MTQRHGGMIEASKPANEEERMASLEAARILDTPIEERFERITRMVCQLLNVPMSSFTLVDAERQWFKSAQGIKGSESPRDISFCGHTILEDNLLHVSDAREDHRFADNPLVTGAPFISFYAGYPVRAPDGHKIGTLCAVDTQPRELTPEQIRTLRDLAAMVETELRANILSKAESDIRNQHDKDSRRGLVDPLTRLWNRYGIMDMLRREWEEAAQTQQPIAIAKVDIDHFKSVNEQYGHQLGDAVLQIVARDFLSALRREDAVGRLGAEEFLIVLPGCLPSALFPTVDRLRLAVTKTPVNTGIGEIHLTASFGAAAEVPKPGEGTLQAIEKLLTRADDALSRAKRAGRNQVKTAT